MLVKRHECRASSARPAANRQRMVGCARWHGVCFAVLVLCVIAFSGCVLPPPVEEAAASENRPPTIDPQFPTRDGEPVHLNCDGSQTLFFANISDDDSDDTLYWRMFIDYYRTAEEDLLATTVTEAPPTRVRSAYENIGKNTEALTERPTDVHVIELLVSDREFDDENPDVESTSIARVPVEGGLTASYQWAVYPIECD